MNGEKIEEGFDPNKEGFMPPGQIETEVIERQAEFEKREKFLDEMTKEIGERIEIEEKYLDSLLKSKTPDGKRIERAIINLNDLKEDRETEKSRMRSQIDSLKELSPQDLGQRLKDNLEKIRKTGEISEAPTTIILEKEMEGVVTDAQKRNLDYWRNENEIIKAIQERKFE